MKPGIILDNCDVFGEVVVTLVIRKKITIDEVDAERKIEYEFLVENNNGTFIKPDKWLRLMIKKGTLTIRKQNQND